MLAARLDDDDDDYTQMRAIHDDLCYIRFKEILSIHTIQLFLIFKKML